MTDTTLNPILDPRGWQERRKIRLAPRVSMETLKKGPVLLFDNTKLGFCNYMEVYRRIKENFAKEGITHIIEHRETVRGKNNQDLIDFAARLKELS